MHHKKKKQKHGELLTDFASCERMIDDKAYSAWEPKHQLILTKKHFNKGLQLLLVQLILMNDKSINLHKMIDWLDINYLSTFSEVFVPFLSVDLL